MLFWDGRYAAIPDIFSYVLVLFYVWSPMPEGSITICQPKSEVKVLHPELEEVSEVTQYCGVQVLQDYHHVFFTVNGVQVVRLILLLFCLHPSRSFRPVTRL